MAKVAVVVARARSLVLVRLQTLPLRRWNHMMVKPDMVLAKGYAKQVLALPTNLGQACLMALEHQELLQLRCLMEPSYR